MPKASGFSFVSSLPEARRQELVDLFFFNPKQPAYLVEINETVLQFGSPFIEKTAFGIRLALPNIPEVQCLFALSKGDNLAGAVLFARNEDYEVEILHMATVPELRATADPCEETGLLLAEIARIARRIKDVIAVRLPYGRGCIRISNHPNILQTSNQQI